MMFWLSILTLICSAVNFSLFIFWWSLIRLDSAPDGKIVEYASSQISLHVTVLGTIIGVGGLFFAVMGVIGFESIRQMLENKADKVAREVVAHYVEKAEAAHLEQQGSRLPDVLKAEEARD